MTDGWIQHGDSNQRDVVKVLLPERGVHFLVGNDKRATRAIAAELAVAVAGGEFPSLQNGGGEIFRFQGAPPIRDGGKTGCKIDRRHRATSDSGCSP